MPYITKGQRLNIDDSLHDLVSDIDSLNMTDKRDYDGVLNYVISKLLIDVLELWEPKYTKFNTAVGVLECAKQELYRRFIGPYEDIKIEENGDIV